MKTYFKILNILVVSIFAGMTILPVLNQNLHFITEETGNENRAKTKKPDCDFNKLDAFVKEYNNYYSDNFNLRENLIKFHNLFEYYLFKVSPAPNDVVVGKDGWFYSKNCVTNYKGANLFTPQELDLYRKEVIKRVRWAAKHGMKYYLVIVPSKMSIYPEHLPDNIIKVSAITRYDQIVALNKEQGVNIIDLKQTLLKHKGGEYDIYQQTDDHWNDLGAYYGYEAIMNRLSQDFPELIPAPLSDFKIITEEHLGNMTKMLNLEKSIPEQFIKLEGGKDPYGYEGKKRGYAVPFGIANWDYEIVRQNDHAKKLKCLIIRDSFTMLMVKYFQEHFKKTIFIHGQWKGQIDQDIIYQERPDILLNIMVETFQGCIIESPFTEKEEKQKGKGIQLRSLKGKYVSVRSDGTLAADDLETTYRMIDLGNNECAFLSEDNYYLSAELGHLNEITATREQISDWEKFKIIILENGFVAFKGANNKYLSLDQGTQQLFASGESIGANEKFEMIQK